MYLIMSFWEPAYQGQKGYYEENKGTVAILLGLEISVFLIFSFELAMDIYHRKFDRNRSFKDKYLLNMKMVAKVFLWIFFFSDSIAYYSSLPVIIFRFSRPFRPGKTIDF
jgi:hypothetical protein